MKPRTWAWLGVPLLACSLVLAWPVVFPLPGPSTTGTGTCFIAQPYTNPRANALDLINDINAQAGSAVTVAVSRCITATDALVTYNGVVGTAFPLVNPEAYFETVTSPVPGYTITGADIAAFGVFLDGPGANSKSGTHCFSLPDDNAIALADAKGLLNLIGPTAVSVSRYNCNNGTFQTYNGLVGVAFPLAPGEGYKVQVNAGTAFVVP
ncbi:MAG TPA: hypothetical protein VJS92_10430 [Candidatus Polarisedimenticolaceae bacterium]|nr:hypothetical protein [Candidatus Polarisedimenticolaceae bacterium]